MVPPQPTRTQGSKYLLGIGKIGGVNDSTPLDCACISRGQQRCVSCGFEEPQYACETTALGVDLDLVGPWLLAPNDDGLKHNPWTGISRLAGPMLKFFLADLWIDPRYGLKLFQSGVLRTARQTVFLAFGAVE
ncbi:hypothetical protein J3458_020401 [Metarhizium acridum]|uniref:uncharacterized protein n=1 Tax=Metarhizium acridum TaxID=92637 RepID=UPI001C6B060C|nr:hypothetical protein J3458_020401 [Metarhizium acridum]